MFTDLQQELVDDITALILVSRAAGESSEETAARIVRLFVDALKAAVAQVA